MRIAYACLFLASTLPPLATTNSARAQDALPVQLTELYSFFDAATKEPLSPRVIDYDETWFITGKVSGSPGHFGEGENWKRYEGKLVYAYFRFPVGMSSLQIQRELEGKLASSGYEIKFKCATSSSDCFTQSGSQYGVSLGILLDKPSDMPRLDAQKMSLVRNYFMPDVARHIYAVKGDDQEGVKFQVSFADSPSKGVTAVTKSIIHGEPTSLSASSAMLSELKEKKSISLDNLLFDVNSAILLPNSRDQLHEIAMMMREDPSIKLQIIGHTDSDGGSAHNLDLSKRRAAAVVEALVAGFDIEAERLTSDGRGLSEPVASNDTSDGKAKNRRVELKLL